MHSAECMSMEDGTAKCVCPEVSGCPKKSDPVCASDGQTYTNDCLLRATSCGKKADIAVNHLGPCGMTQSALT